VDFLLLGLRLGFLLGLSFPTGVQSMERPGQNNHDEDGHQDAQKDHSPNYCETQQIHE
jgi:hypothetical protein